MLNPPPVADLLAELAAFPSSLAPLRVALDVNWLRRPAPDDWSLGEVMCHLRDVELEVHRPRFRAVLAEESPFIAGVDADLWAEPRRYREQNGRLALETFLRAREETLALLDGLPPAAWNRLGQHAFFGPTTLQELLYLAVQHDRIHGQQIEQLLRSPGDD